MNALRIIGLLGLLGISRAEAQDRVRVLPVRSFAVQYAGSIGSGSIGYMRSDTTERIGVGLSFGHVSRAQGGPLNTWSLRFLYSPWKLRVSEHGRLEPLQVGLFISYTTGFDLRASWPTHLEKGYYWWLPNFRQHPYVRSQLSFERGTGVLRRVGAYLEVNTNDLYIYSWWPNRGTITVGDILFLGAGVQVFFAPHRSR